MRCGGWSDRELRELGFGCWRSGGNHSWGGSYCHGVVVFYYYFCDGAVGGGGVGDFVVGLFYYFWGQHWDDGYSSDCQYGRYR